MEKPQTWLPSYVKTHIKPAKLQMCVFFIYLLLLKIIANAIIKAIAKIDTSINE